MQVIWEKNARLELGAVVSDLPAPKARQPPISAASIGHREKLLGGILGAKQCDFQTKASAERKAELKHDENIQ